MDNRVKLLYDALKSDGADVGTEQEFNDWFFKPGEEGYRNRREVWDVFNADGADVGANYEEFRDWLNLVPKPAAVDKPVGTRDGTFDERGYYIPSAADWAAAVAPNDVTSVADTLHRADISLPQNNSVIGADKKDEPVDMSLPSDSMVSDVVGEPWRPAQWQKDALSKNLRQSVAGTVAMGEDLARSAGRQTERYTEEGRRRLRDAEMRARVAGTPTSVAGIAPDAPLVGDVVPDGKNITSTESPVPYSVVYNADGKPRTQWLMPDGSLTTDIAEADRSEFGARGARLQQKFIGRMRQNGLNPAKEEDIERQQREDALDEAQKLVDKGISDNEDSLHKVYNKKAKEFDEQNSWNDEEGFWDNFVRIVGGAARRGVTANTPKPEQSQTRDDKDIRNLVATNQFLSAARKRLEARRLRKSNGWAGGFFDIANNMRNIAMGAKHAVDDADFYTGGIMSLQQGSRLLGIEDKLKQGETLSDSELSLVYSAMLCQRVEGNVDLPHGYTAGQTMTQMVPFMMQMALNPASGLSRALVSKYGKTGLKKIALTLAGDVAESAVLANTLQAPATIADAIGRYQGGVIERDGKFVFDGDHNWASAVGKAEGAAIIENYTEMLGNHFGSIGSFVGNKVHKGASKIVGGKVMDNVTNLVTRMRTNDWVKAIGNIEKRANWNGTIGEILEEESGIVLNSMFVGDNKISDLWDVDQQIDIVLGVGLFGGFVSGIKTVGYPVSRAKAKADLHTRDNIGRARFGDEWDAIRDGIESADEMALSDIVCNIINSQAMSAEQQGSIVKYAYAMVKARGYDISIASRIAEGNISPEEQDAEESFDHGSDIAVADDGRAMRDAKMQLDLHRERLVGILGEDMIGEFDSDPIGSLMKCHEDELRAVASDYVNARMMYDGIIHGVRDNIESEIAYSDARIDRCVNRSTGKLQGAVMKLKDDNGSDRRVYVVDGRLVANDDGSINHGKSDGHILICDAETGKVEFSDPSSVLSLDAELDPALEKEAAAEGIRERIAAEAGNRIDGTLGFASGDVYDVYDGKVMSELTVVGDAVDENGVALPDHVVMQSADGSQSVMARGDVQAMSDAAGMERMAMYERDLDAERYSRSKQADGRNSSIGALAQIPLDENGKPVFTMVDPDLAWDGLVEMVNDADIALAYANNMVSIKVDALKKAQKSKTRAIEDVEEFAAAEARRRAVIDGLRVEHERWTQIAETPKRRVAAVEAERKAADAAEAERVAELRRRADTRNKTINDLIRQHKDDDQVMEILTNLAPQNLHEVAAMVLSTKKVLLGDVTGVNGSVIRSGAMAQAGIGEKERRKLFGLFASAERGGQSIERLAEDEFAEVCRDHGIAYDNQAARDAIIDVIRSANTTGDIYSYIADRRIEQAESLIDQRRRHEEMMEENFYQEAYHLIKAEYEAMETELEKQATDALRNLDESEYYGNIADEIVERQKKENELRGNKESIAEGESDSGSRSDEVLPPSQSAEAGGDRQSAEQGAWSGGEDRGTLSDTAGYVPESSSGRAEVSGRNTVVGLDKLSGKHRSEAEEYLSDHWSAPVVVLSDDEVAALNMPQEAKDEILRDNETLGGYNHIDGKVYIFVDRLSGSHHLGNVLAHENVHALVDMIGDECVPFLQSFRESLTSPAVKSDLFRKIYNTIYDTYDTSIADEEFVAYVIEQIYDNPKRISQILYYLSQSDAKYLQNKIINRLYGKGKQILGVDAQQPGAGRYREIAPGGNGRTGSADNGTGESGSARRSGKNSGSSEKQRSDVADSLGSKIADNAEVEESTPENPVSTTGSYTIDTYTTKKNKTYHRIIFPRADKAVWQERLNLAKKMGGTSVPKGYGFKTREDAETFAKAVTDPAVVADAQPLSLDDMRSSIEEASATTTTEAEQETEFETQQPEADKLVNLSGNKLVTDERYAELRERMRKKLGGQLNMGVDPEILAIGTEMAVYHIEKGARKFKAYASAMIADLDDAIRPYLKAFYNAVRDMPEAEAAGLVADMDSYDDVRSVDIANFDKPSTDALATAAAVVAEQEAEKEREEAEAKLKGKRKKRTNPDGTTTEPVAEGGTEIEITTGDFIPGVRPTIDEQKPTRKKFSETKPKAPNDGGLFDTVEDETIEVPALAVPKQRPTVGLMGDSAAFQEREAQTAGLVEEIGGVIESRVTMLQLDAESVKPLTMTDIKKMASKYPALKDISDTDLQELVELAMTQLTRSEALINIDGTAEAQRSAFDHIVNLYQIQPNLNARDSERLMKQQYSTPTPFGFVMGQFVRAGGKAVGSMLEPSAGNGALTITVHPSLVHVNDIDDTRLANLRKLGYGQVTAQDALLQFAGDKVDVVMTNPPFGTITEKVYDGVFRISSLEGQMAINALEQMKDDGRAAIVIGGNTSYRTNGSMNPKDAAFFGYLYSHYNVADVINISGKALYSRNGTGYDVRMILINGRKTGEFERVFPPVKAKARAEQVTTFDELYKRVQDDIQQIQQMGSQLANVQRDPETAADGTTSAPVRTGNNRPNTGAGQRPGTTGDTVRDTPRTDSGQPTPGNDGSSPAGVDNAVTGNAGSIDDVPQPNPEQPRSVGSGSTQNGTGRSGSDGRGAVASRPDRGAERLAVKPDLTTEKVPYPNQSDNGFTLMSVVPAAQAQVLQKSLGEIGDVDQYLVDELGYSSKEELYKYLAAEQIDSVALAIHQMNKGNAFIIGDMTGVGKGRQGAALIRYAVKQGKVPIYFTQKPTLFTDNYRDLADIGSSDLRPFIIASNPKDANIVDTDGNIVHKLPSKKEQERVFNYIMEHGTLPEEYDYVLTTYDQIKNGTADYTQNEDGTWNTEARKLPKKSKGYTTADYNGQARRDALARLAEGNIAILDESHTVGGDSGCGRYMQMLTSSAEGVTFLSATFAKRADNMPIYAQRTAIAEAGVKASELIEAISKGGVTLQEIMSKQLVESGQMIRRERSFEGVTIDWLSVEDETNRRQRQQFNEVADIFNAIRNFQDDYITPIIDAKNEAAAEFGATVGHTQGTKDLGVKNVPFASKMYNLVNQLLFALKVDAVADRVVENLRNGYKPVISFTNTMEGFLSSAPKGVAMDDVPNFSLTLMRALDGVMRFTEKDADENTEGGSISLSDLSTEGQNAYNAIREKIINLSADLPISPMDAIRIKIEEAGYSVAEITGRTMQLNRTEDGRYIVEARKDRDKKAAMRDFNSGKLDVLMINKSGSTGISLHASSKFEDQRPRVMVFAQFQSDINDEVQMRGRIDRSGQVTRGRYEYIMSTIPAEQRIQMMFKAKLKSLDANTTSSQKSKFNEMEIVDYLNKYGDDVVWEYMKEHPELEERLGDPLDMLQEKKAEDGPRTSEKEDTSKKTGCAGKISRYLAFLSVEEQDEIFREITEAYRVKIQLLDDAGENDLEITTMPLRAETKQKKIWHEGENPGSGNAFADNTYVEEVEVDVLKKPMKRDEIVEATRKLMGEHYTEKNGGVDWQHYVRAKGDEISLFFQAKADEAVGKLREAGEARIAKTREKAVTAATKARGRGENNFTDEQIQSLAATVANEEREKELQKQRKRQEEIMAIKHRLQSLLQCLRAGGIYVVPQDLKQGTAEMFTQTFGTFVGFKFNKGYTLGSSTAIFATLDGRRKVELALSDQAINTIISATDIANRYSPDEIRAISLDNWDSKVPTQTRQKRYIITGNLLQALVDTEKGEKTRGNLISFSTIDGETRQGILMGENFKLTDLRNSASLSSRLAQIREGKAVVSENGDVQIEKVSFGWQHRGQYELRVPKSKQRGGIYTMHSDLLKLVEGHNFITKGNNMVAYVDDTDIAKVVDMLSRAPFNLTVLQESQLTDVSAEEAEDDVLCRPVTDKATLNRLNSEPTIKVYRAMQMINGGLRPPMSAKVDGQLRDATEVGVWEEAEEHPEMADENGRFKLDKGNGKSIKAAYNPYIHTSRSPINDQFSSAWSRPELVTVEVEVPVSELTSEYHAEKAKDTVGEKEWKSGPVGRALAKVGQARHVILSRWSRIVRVVPVEEVAEAYAQRLNAHGIEVPFNTVPPALRDALAERGVKIGKPEKGNAGKASMPAFEQWIMEQERMRQGDGYGAYSDAEVSYMNDPVSKVMGKNRFSKKRQAEFAARERKRMVDRVHDLATRLHLENVDIITDVSQLDGRRSKAKGFYNKRTGRITIVVPNNVSVADVEITLLHEAVAHYGLRKMFGAHFDTFLDNVYAAADESIRRKIVALAAQNGWDFRTATEEYLASLAETTEFENLPETFWMKIKRLFLDMLDKIGFDGFRNTGVVLSDNELRYLLWHSYEELKKPGKFRSIIGEAEDIVKQSELKVGNYAEQDVEADYAAEPTRIGDKTANNVMIEEGKAPSTREDALKLLSQMSQPFKNDDQGVDIYVSKSNARHSMSFRNEAQIKAIGKIGQILKEAIKIGEMLPTADEMANTKKVHIYYCPVNIGGNQYSARMVVKEYYEGDKVLDQLNLYNYQLKEMAPDAQSHSQTLPAHPSKAKIRYKISELVHKTQESDARFIDEESEDLFRFGGFTPIDRAVARDAYERMVSTGSFQFQEAVQDSMLGLRRLYSAVLGKDMKIEDVAGYENAYLYENRMSSTNAGEQYEYYIRYVRPLLKSIGKITGSNSGLRQELSDYLMAKHGLERNLYMRDAAKAKGDTADRDFAGLTSLTGESDWRSAEREAQKIVSEYESRYDTSELWDNIRSATRATLDKIYSSGLLSAERYEQIRDMYDFYIPLQGFDQATSDEKYGYLTSKDSPLIGAPIKAHGRSTKADDPIATICMMADTAICQGNRNIMKQRFLNFALNHPSDAVSVNDVWLEYDTVNDEWRPVFAKLDPSMTTTEVEHAISAFESRMESLSKLEPDKYKRGHEAQQIPYIVKSGNMREHQVLVKRNGRTYVMTINGNPRAAQALNGLTNPDVHAGGVMDSFLKAGEYINRQLSALYTTRNPDFVVSNLIRDTLYSNCMTWVKENPRYALRYHRNFGRFNPAKMRVLLGKWDSGTLDHADPIEYMFYQFMRNGGETGYTSVKDIEGHKKTVAAELKKQGNMTRKAWHALGLQLELLNRSAENCARFAAFVTSREMGRSLDRSIYDAKEVSVNFNKKGSGDRMLNAVGQTRLGKFGAGMSGAGRALYVFWNAGVQGSMNFGRAAKRHPYKAMAGVTAMIALGYIIPLLAQGDDDDDKNAYYNLPEYTRRSNICINAGDQWITIPLPIEFRALYGLGELASGVLSGKERYTSSELAYQIASQFSQILPLDMLEGGGLSAFIPSAIKPIVEVSTNKGWTGLPIYKDTPYNKDDPEWTKAYRSTDKHLVELSKWLNEITGGDDINHADVGWIDINPAQVEYLLKGYFGGIYSTFDKLKKTYDTAIGNREFEWRNTLIFNRVIKSGDERTAYRKLLNEYFDYQDEYENTGKLLKSYSNAEMDGIVKYAEKVAFLYTSPEYIRYEIFDKYKPEIDVYQKFLKENPSEEEKAEIETEQYRVMRELVNALNHPDDYLKDMGLEADSFRERRQSRIEAAYKKKIRKRERLQDQYLKYEE